jgi:hypothetical protein
LGREDLNKLEQYQVDDRGDGLAKLKKTYEEVEGLLVRPCSALPNRFCSAGLYYASLMAETLAKSVLQITISNQLAAEESRRMQQEVSQIGKWFEDRAKSHAFRAEKKLRYGVPETGLFSLVFEQAEKLRGVNSPLSIR